MNSAAHLWVTKSNGTTQTLVAAVGVVIGVLLVLGSRSAGGWSIGTVVAFVLGLGLLVAGLALLFSNSRQTVTVDGKARRITIENKHRFGKSSRQLRFDEIADAYVDEVGDRDGGSISYHVVLKLKTGKKVPLFAGFFDGSYSESATEARRRRLLQYVKGTN